jgi:hypothetical protein
MILPQISVSGYASQIKEIIRVVSNEFSSSQESLIRLDNTSSTVYIGGWEELRIHNGEVCPAFCANHGQFGWSPIEIEKIRFTLPLPAHLLLFKDFCLTASIFPHRFYHLICISLYFRIFRLHNDARNIRLLLPSERPDQSWLLTDVCKTTK